MDACREFKELLESHNENQITQELCDRVTQHSDHRIPLKLIPKQFRTRDLCMRYLKWNPCCYDKIPKELMDKEMWSYIFKLDGRVINRGDIPKEMVNREMYEIAVVHGRLQIQEVPCVYRSIESCLYAISCNNQGNRRIAFDYIPENIRLNKLHHIKLVSTHGLYLQRIPPEDRTVDVYKAAIENDACAARYLPNESEELMPMVAALIKDDKYGRIFEYIPKYYKTKDVCMAAVAIKGTLLCNVPEELVDKKMCKIAVANNRRAENWFPEDIELDDL